MLPLVARVPCRRRRPAHVLSRSHHAARDPPRRSKSRSASRRASRTSAASCCSSSPTRDGAATLGRVRRGRSGRTTRPRRSTPRGSRSANGSRRACSAARSTSRRGVHAVLERELPRPQHGEGGARDGLLGARRPSAQECRSSRCSAARAIASHGHLARHPADARRARRARAARGRRRLSQDQDQDPARRRTSSSCAPCARRSATDVALMADANTAYTLDDADTSRSSTRST